MKPYFYYHPESGSAFASYDPPHVVMSGVDGAHCNELSEHEFHKVCCELGVKPVIPEAPVSFCPETRNRIRVALAAWAYEVHNDPLMPDHLYDKLALSIDVRKSTARPDLDEWFRDNFNPHTGMWVLNHPERDRIEALYQRIAYKPVELTVWEMILISVLRSPAH